MSLQLDLATLRAALVGYQQQLEEINSKMAEIRRQLRGAAGKSGAAAEPAHAARPKKHRMSAEGRARIAAAQRARWARAKKAKKVAAAGAAG